MNAAHLSPYGHAARAAEIAKRATVPACQRLAYARRCAFRAVRAACPYVSAHWAWFIARSAAAADTVCYLPSQN